MSDLILPLAVVLVLGAVFFRLLRTKISFKRRRSQWREPFDGVKPKPAISTRDARQAYHELRALDALEPSAVEEVKAQALKELQQIVEDHHKKQGTANKERGTGQK